jgi:L-asparaginase II
VTLPVLAEVTRQGLVESVHHGSLVVTGSLHLGDVTGPMYPRSALKPLQALGMLRCGLDLAGARLALACASHGGEPFHLEGVRAILADAGLDETHLQNTPGLPLNDAARKAYGHRETSLAGNCSGKHAAMLATCVLNGWPTKDYLKATHPLQRTIISTIEECCRERAHTVAVDGCGAPAVAISLTALARGLAELRRGTDLDQRRIVAAMTGHPEHVGYGGRVDTRVMRAIPGALAKVGAEGVLVVALPDGRGLALKIADGNGRALPPVVVAALRAIGWDSADPTDFDELRHVPTFGHGKEVGEVRATSVIAESAADDLP